MVTLIVLSITGVMTASLMKKDRPEIAYCINILLCVIIAGFVIKNVTEYINEWRDWQNSLLEYHQYLQLLFKMIGVTYLCETASDICKDAGYQAVASQIIILGKCVILFVGIPIIEHILNIVERFW